MKNFQLITMVVFLSLAVFGILVFSGILPIGNDDEAGGLGTVVLWGTIKTEIMGPLLEEFNNANPTYIVKYVQKPVNTFDQNLLEALATGTGPDMFFLPDNLVFHYANKIFTIPHQSYSLASFKNNFAGAGEVFLNAKGISAIPLSIDPLVMYYNRSMLDANGIVKPPAFWDEVSTITPVLTKKDETNKIMKSAVALGHFSNITHAKDIITTLFMQGGNPIVMEKDGFLGSALSLSNQTSNLATILKFYTSFADPNGDVYSWNKSFSNSSDAFSKEDLAFYFGYASELMFLVNKNPNQNFSVAPFPQNKNANFKVTGAHVLGIALLSSSKNFNTAFIAANTMTAGDFASKFSSALGVAPARRDLLKIKQTDAYSPIFYDSALYAKSWLDPSSRDSSDIFRRMVDGVLSNTMSAEEAISDASSKLGLLLLK